MRQPLHTTTYAPAPTTRCFFLGVTFSNNAPVAELDAIDTAMTAARAGNRLPVERLRYKKLDFPKALQVTNLARSANLPEMMLSISLPLVNNGFSINAAVADWLGIRLQPEYKAVRFRSAAPRFGSLARSQSSTRAPACSPSQSVGAGFIRLTPLWAGFLILIVDFIKKFNHKTRYKYLQVSWSVL